MFESPIFIFSLPRSGSTLLQRMLACHSNISTTAEPWFLLPLIYTIRKSGTFAQYSHLSLRNAMDDLIEQLPNGMEDYFTGLRSFAFKIYNGLNHEDTKYFLDKTPRYYLIIDEIDKIFPNAKFIFLFRNPLAVISSNINSFYKGRLGDWRHKIDLFEGPEKIVKGYQSLSHKSIVVNYENLLRKPQQQIKQICEYLQIDYQAKMIDHFNLTQFKGKMGDQFGTKKYQTIESETLEKWKTTIGTRLRKKYVVYYLKKIGSETIQKMGYDMNTLIEKVNQLDSKNTYLFTDILQLSLCEIRTMFEIPLLKENIKQTRLKLSKKFVHY